MRVSLVIPTFEPKFEISDESQTLWKFYKKNFKSWLQPKGVCDPVKLRLLIVDYRSSADFRQLLRQFADQNAEIDLLLGDHTLSSTKALNVGLQETVDADLCAYVASDSAAVDSNWLKLVDAEFRANPSTSVIFTTCSVGGCEISDQVQMQAIDKPAKILSAIELPVPNVVFFRADLMKKFGHQIGDVLVNDLGFSLYWMAEAIDTQRALSYRVFVDHDHFVERGRHKRIVLKNTFSEDFRSVRKISRSLFIPRGYFPKPWPPLSLSHIVYQTLQPIEKKTSVPALAIYGYRFFRILTGRLLKTLGIHFVRQQVLTIGCFNYMFQQYFFNKKLNKFRSNSIGNRVLLVKRLFFTNWQ